MASAALAGVAVGLAATADTPPEWVTSFPMGSTLAANMSGMVTDDAGVTYITGNHGSSSNFDIFTAAIGPDGATLWTASYNGPGNWHDQSRAIGLGANGTVLVTGTTPGANHFANVLLLTYDAATGSLLDTVQFTNGVGISEFGNWVLSDAQGSVYITGGTVGDGGDVLTMKFSPAGNLLWQKVWDGPAWSPYSGDSGIQALLDPQGDLVVLAHGMWNSLQPDYVVIKYDGETGEQLWLTNWGGNGGEYAREMVLDAAGDVYITGTGIDFIDKYSTIKLRGSDGGLVWQQYDSLHNDHYAAGIALDGVGGVYITGSADPEGDHSNFNDNFFTVKRDAATGALQWTHAYGSNAVGQYDIANDVIADASGRVFVVGTASSPPYSADLLMFQLDAATGAEVDRFMIPGGTNEMSEGFRLQFDPSGNLFTGGEFYNVNTGAVTAYVARFGQEQSQLLKAPLTAASVQWGTRISGNRRALEDDDDLVVRMESEVATNGQKWVQLLVSAQSPVIDAARLDVTTIARVTMPGVKARVWLRNFSTNRWDPIGLYSQPMTELEKSFTNIANPAAYVRDSDGLMQMRIRYSNVTDHFESYTDLVQFDVME